MKRIINVTKFCVFSKSCSRRIKIEHLSVEREIRILGLCKRLVLGMDILQGSWALWHLLFISSLWILWTPALNLQPMDSVGQNPHYVSCTLNVSLRVGLGNTHCILPKGDHANTVIILLTDKTFSKIRYYCRKWENKGMRIQQFFIGAEWKSSLDAERTWFMLWDLLRGCLLFMMAGNCLFSDFHVYHVSSVSTEGSVWTAQVVQGSWET